MPNARKLSKNLAQVSNPPSRKTSRIENSRFHVNPTHHTSLDPNDDGGGGSDDYDHGFSQNQMTYVYDTRNHKSMNQLTREALPNLEHYRGTILNNQRPSLDELRNPAYDKKPKQVEDVEDGPVLKGKVVKFGWLEGVLMRCLLNIWGAMLFLRLSWLVGQGGVLQGILIISLANLVTFITALSMSAVSTNGQIRGGGIYYMISRSLGPEFGAAIGLMFTLANSISAALHIVGFCESLNDLLKANGIEKIVDGTLNDTRVVGIGVLIAILILAFVGMDWVTRTQMLLLVVLIASQVDFIVGSIIGPIDDDERARGFIGFNSKTFGTNFWADYGTGYGSSDAQQSFFTVFGVFFPAVTGIVAGANLSGDLKDPAASIPKGTLLAISITYITYIIYAAMMGGCALREVSGNVTQYLNMDNFLNETWVIENPNELRYDDCVNQTCEYGLKLSAQVMELISSWGPLIYMGCFAASLSSAIASLVGAPRVFQALCKDKLYPGIYYFAKGYGANNDPVRGYMLVFVISTGGLLIADLNGIAPILSNFFLMAYSLINFSCFHATITKSPGWRPAFKYYNGWVSLVGSVLCIVVMFLMSWVIALVTVACIVFLYLYVSYRKPDVNWGSSTQAQSFNSALKSVQDLNLVEDHVKNYRPQILILSGMPSARPPLIDFGSLIVKNLSLLICAQVVKGPHHQKTRNALTKQAYNWLAKHKKKGFYTMIENESFETGCKSIMQTCGLGKLRPNMVLMGYKGDWQRCSRQEFKEYFNVIHEALDMYFAVGILRVQEGLDYTGVIDVEDYLAPQQNLDESKNETDKDTTGNQSESQLSNVESESETGSTPTSPKIEDQPAPPPAAASSDANKLGILGKLKKRKISASAKYMGPGGTPLPREVRTNVAQFRRKQKPGTIDVWWLYDDGGLTLLLPYLLSTRSQFAGCTLRIFSLASKKDDLGSEQRNMAALLSKFRIDYSDVIVIHDVTKKAEENTKKEFEALIAPFKSKNSNDGTSITDAELVAHVEKTNRHLRLRELLLTHSQQSTFIVMTLPMPRKGTISAPLYMSWLEMMTKGMPPFLVVRGNQQSVLTFYS